MSRNHQSEYLAALTKFDEIRRQETRISESGQEFVLVENVTKRLRVKDGACPEGYDHTLDCLEQTAYLQFDSNLLHMKKRHYDDILTVFYVLLDIRAPSCVHLFRNLGYDTLPIDLDVLRRDIKSPWPSDDFHRSFHSRQFAWCPILFDLNMSRMFRDCICPFLRKEKITPYRHGKESWDNKALLYAVDIPEEVVEPRLQLSMASARIERHYEVPEGSISNGNIYRFALKQFKPLQHMYGYFENEKDMFSNLKNEDGIIRYIGWFQSFERVGQDKYRQYHNIVLELADFDFCQAILKEPPPTSVEEIRGFWDSMSAISRAIAFIHTDVTETQSNLRCHGNIKPENILRANGRFKLADTGEAGRQLNPTEISDSTQSRLSRGTRTYAAPETAAYFDQPWDKGLQITPESDVWSFGCVLSIAATYVVLGNQGILIYDELRRRATYLAQKDLIGAFHDGKGVLSSVTQWHQHLRETVRKTDLFTGAVLDMVDNHMLVVRDRRWEARLVQEEFKGIIARCQTVQSRVPSELVDLIHDVNSQAEREYDQHSGFTTRLPPSDIELESQSVLLRQPIQPTVQRFRELNGPPLLTPRQAFSIPSLIETTKTDAYHPQGPTWADLQRRDTMTSDLSQSTQMRMPAVSLKPPPRDTKVEEVRQLLKRTGLTYKPEVTSLGSLFSRQKTAIKGGTLHDKKLEYLDQQLKAEFEGRDIVFLVDNGRTMSTWWTSATELLEVLVWRALGYDDDGMELYFTNPDTNPNAIIDSTKAKSVKKKVKKYTEAMDKAKPATAGPKAYNTTILPELERIINGYARAKSSKNEPRKKTIIILTDGLWLGMHDEYTLEVYLRSAFQSLKDLHGDVTYVEAVNDSKRRDISILRPVTIQFVKFGDDPQASERLRRLDNDMRSWACPDLIDIEDADGDIYKMFLGSLCADVDRKRRYSPYRPASPSMSSISLSRSQIQESQVTQAQEVTSSNATFSNPARLLPSSLEIDRTPSPLPRILPLQSEYHEPPSIFPNDTSGQIILRDRLPKATYSTAQGFWPAGNETLNARRQYVFQSGDHEDTRSGKTPDLTLFPELLLRPHLLPQQQTDPSRSLSSTLEGLLEGQPVDHHLRDLEEDSMKSLNPEDRIWSFRDFVNWLTKDTDLGVLLPRLILSADSRELNVEYIARVLARYAFHLAEPDHYVSTIGTFDVPILLQLRYIIANKLVNSRFDVSEIKHATTCLGRVLGNQATIDDVFIAPEPQLRSFLFGGSPFRELQYNIGLALGQRLSPTNYYNLGDVIVNFINDSKTLVMTSCLAPKCSQICWTCICGRKIKGQYVEKRPGALERLELQLKVYSRLDLANPSPSKRVKVSRDSHAYLPTWIIRKVYSLLWYRRRNGASDQEGLPQHHDNSMPLGTPSRQTFASQSDNPAKPPDTSESCTTGITHSFLLLCIPFMQWAVKAYQPDICTVDSDQAFFKLMGDLYRAERKAYRWSWLKRVNSINFVKFELLPKDFANVWKAGFLPIGPGYTYDEPETDPPLDSDTLMHFFENPDHASSELILFHKFPRKMGDKVNPCPDQRFPHGWGLQFVEILAGKHVFFFGIVGFSLSLMAAIVWTCAKDDIQGGFGIGAFLLAFVLFCGTIAHIYIR